MPPVVINGRLRTTLNGISYSQPKTPLKLVDQYDKKGVYTLDFPRRLLKGPPRLGRSVINGDKLVRATELAKLLTLEKSLKGAIKLVTALKLPLLAERFNGILEERLSNDCGAAPAPSLASNDYITNLQPPKSSLECEIKRTAEPSTTLPATSMPHPHFSKHRKMEEDSTTAKVGVNPTNPFAKVPDLQEKAENKLKEGRACDPSKITSRENSKEQTNRTPLKVASEGVSTERPRSSIYRKVKVEHLQKCLTK